MRRLRSVFFLIVMFTSSTVACSASQRTVNVRDFGARGDGLSDNAGAFEKAFQHCAEQNKACFIPKSEKPYLVKRTVRLPLNNQHLKIRSDGAIIEIADRKDFQTRLIWKLTAHFPELAIWSFGPNAASNTLASGFTAKQKNSVDIAGLIFQERHPDFAKDGAFVSAIDLSVDKVTLNNLVIRNIKGYGIRSFGASAFHVNELSIKNVGGRGDYPAFDAYGDGVYISLLKPGAQVSIKNSNLEGAYPNKRRSRSGITFEYSTQPYSALIENTNISRFSKAVHMEEEAAADLKINTSNFSEFNYAVVMTRNKKARLRISDSKILCPLSDGVDPGDGGPVLNIKGGRIDFTNSIIDLNGRHNAYISMVGVQTLTDCTIIGNNKNPYLADASMQFNRCTFVDFGGPSFSFFSYGNNTQAIDIRNSTFQGGGPVHAKGQRVNLNIQ